MSTLLRTSLLLLLALPFARTASAQTPADSAARRAADSTSRTSADSAQKPPAPPAADPGPDPSLVAACTPAKGGAPIGRVLLVVFTRRTTPEQQKEAATAVGGTLAGEAPGGETFVAIPVTVTVRDVADRMILQRGVSEVSELECP